MSKIAYPCGPALRLKRSGVEAKLWPNGEIAFHLPKRLKEAPLVPKRPMENRSIWAWWIAAKGLGSAVQQALLMGLSNVPNFDKTPKPQTRSGLRGISSLGRRRVRNACFMMTREVGKHRLTFATVTIPNLSSKAMMLIAVNWHKVIDCYRRMLRRQLVRSGLPGEIVGVSEIQEGRYAHSGFPALHGHFVFVGALRSGLWCITPQRHDFIWRKSLESVLPVRLSSVSASCQLKRVEKAAEGYLGKYMSKGGSAIAAIVADGFDWALPKQWWNCSRSIVKRMNGQVRYFNEGVGWLIERAAAKDTSIWAYYSVVSVTMPSGEIVDVGSYGRLTPAVNGKIRVFLQL